MSSIRKLLGMLIFFGLIVEDSFSSMKPLEDIDFSHLNVVSKATKRILEEDEEHLSSSASTYSDADSIAEKFDRLDLDPTKTYVLSFSQDGMDDKGFEEVTRQFLPRFQPKKIKCDILDLSFNHLTDKSAKYLKEWRDSLDCDFITLNGNPRSSKKYRQEKYVFSNYKDQEIFPFKE